MDDDPFRSKQKILISRRTKGTIDLAASRLLRREDSFRCMLECLKLQERHIGGRRGGKNRVRKRDTMKMNELQQQMSKETRPSRARA